MAADAARTRPPRIEIGSDLSEERSSRVRRAIRHQNEDSVKCMRCKDTCPISGLREYRRTCCNCSCLRTEHDLPNLENGLQKETQEDSTDMRSRLSARMGVAADRRRKYSAPPERLKNIDTDLLERIHRNALNNTLNEDEENDSIADLAPINNPPPVRRNRRVSVDTAFDRIKLKEKLAASRANRAADDSDLSRLRKSTTFRDGMSEYLWVPPGLKRPEVRIYLKSLPQNKTSAKGTPGEEYYLKQRDYQILKHDMDPTCCKHVPDDKKEEMQNSISEAKKVHCVGLAKCLDEEKVCRKCLEKASPGDIAVLAAGLGEDVFYHPKCFTCEFCKELLAELNYYHKNGHIYCGRHYAELDRNRCGECEEIIYDETWKTGLGKFYHVKHFMCWKCRKTLEGLEFTDHDDHVVCTECYAVYFAKVCHECSKKITARQNKIRLEKYYWHEDCFNCVDCNKLLDRCDECCLHDDELVCITCYYRICPPIRCKRCEKILTSACPKKEYDDNLWHVDCFEKFKAENYLCGVCDKIIKKEECVPVDIPNIKSRVVCNKCYESCYAKKCEHCKKNIGHSDIPSMKEDKLWHTDCFLCEECRLPLAGHEDESVIFQNVILCQRCYIKGNPDRRCKGCGDQFTTRSTFREVHKDLWHEECFIKFQMSNYVCLKCKKPVKENERVILDYNAVCMDCYNDHFHKVSDKTEKRVIKGDKHCYDCREILDVRYFFVYDGYNYCPKCYSKVRPDEKCAACGEAFKSGYQRLEQKKKLWHTECFSKRCKEKACAKCEEQLPDDEMNYINDSLHCNKCFYEHLAKTCARCHGSIDLEDAYSKGKTCWHKSCFVCADCRLPLQKGYHRHEGELLCNRCRSKVDVSKFCQGCNEGFEVPGSSFEYNGSTWHTGCFTCKSCKIKLENGPFLRKDDNLLCIDCYKKTYAVQWVEGHETHLESGLVKTSQSWNRASVCCYQCHDSLASRAYTIKQGKKYCTECLAKIFEE